MTVSAIESQARPGTLRRWLPYLQDAVLVVVSGMFLYIHGHRVVVDHVVTSLPFAAEQGLLVGIFLTRRRSVATSTRLFDWAAAFGGAWLTLFMHPADSARMAEIAGTAVQMAGLTGSAFCMFYLGRSFGVVAANRGLKVGGPYGFVRHPIYAFHLLTISGFIAANFDGLNLLIALTAWTCQLLRINAEERVLNESSSYDEYRQSVRFRLIPFVY